MGAGAWPDPAKLCAVPPVLRKESAWLCGVLGKGWAPGWGRWVLGGLCGTARAACDPWESHQHWEPTSTRSPPTPWGFHHPLGFPQPLRSSGPGRQRLGRGAGIRLLHLAQVPCWRLVGRGWPPAGTQPHAACPAQGALLSALPGALSVLTQRRADSPRVCFCGLLVPDASPSPFPSPPSARAGQGRGSKAVAHGPG